MPNDCDRDCAISVIWQFNDATSDPGALHFECSAQSPGRGHSGAQEGRIVGICAPVVPHWCFSIVRPLLGIT